MTDSIAPEPRARQSRPPGCVVVGLGASAGGLEAFRAFLSNMRPDSGMAFVLVQHLDPQHKSLMHELLSAHTAMPVQQAEDGVSVEPDHVYVISPNSRLTLQDGMLCVTPRGEARSQRGSIDTFFRSLAEDQGDGAVAVVLSGIGHDGALGLKAVKEHGGLTIAQSAESARNPAMPMHAISTGLVDHVLAVEDIPAHLIEYARHLTELRDSRPDGIGVEAKDWLPEICGLLKQRTGHDFNHYKRTTLVRRMQRRIQLLQLGSVAEYVELLRSDFREPEQLVKDLLIGVTCFFRDPEAFEALASSVIPKLCEKKPVEEPLRIWVAGCASGEEAYTLAILIYEHLAVLDAPRPVQIFATDIDDEALETARQARYPVSIAEQVSAKRLARFFTHEAAGYQLKQPFREMCIFSQHNLIRDPPFSRLDLISCRNLLIYLESDLQHKLLNLFHYALSPGAHLFLGPSENVTGRSDLFRAVDKKLRIFQKKRVVVHAPPQLPFGEESRLGKRLRHETPRMAVSAERDLENSLERLLLESYAPPCIIVNEQSEIVYFSGRTGKYLEPPSGALDVGVVNMVIKSLRAEVRAAVHRAIKTRELVVHENVTVETNAGPQRLNLVVRPLEQAEDAGLFALVLQELAPAQSREEGALASPSGESPLLEQLENELKATKEHLQTTIEELETSNEELKSSNEELLSMNEELQSLNEEFETVNAELKAKVEELDTTNSDLQNLLLSTRIPTLFLDESLCIRRFTPAATEVFRLIDSDIGRPITDMAPRFDATGLVSDAKEVLRTLQPKESAVPLEDGRCCYIMRTLPYRTTGNVIAGVVITFVDITKTKEAQRQNTFLAAIVESSQEAIIGVSAKGLITSWNSGAQRMYGYAAEEVIGHSMELIVPSDRTLELQMIHAAASGGEPVKRLETQHCTRDGLCIDVSLSVFLVRDSTGDIIGASLFIHDITRRKLAEAELEKRTRELADFVENATLGLHWEGLDGIIQWTNRAELSMLGYTAEEYIGHHIAEFHADQAVIDDILRRLTAHEELHDYPAQLLCKDGSIKHALINANVYWENGAFAHTRCFTRDVTAQVKAEAALRTSEEEFRSLFENVAVGIVQCEPRTGRFLRVNRGFCELIGYAVDELTQLTFIDVTHEDDAARDRAALQAMAEGRAPEYIVEKRYVRKDGQVIWAHTKASMAVDAKHGVTRCMAVIQDITLRKQAEFDLIRAHQAAEDASQAKDQFLAMLSHELRTPLTPVLTAAAILKRREGLPADVLERIEMIRRNIELEARLIDDLLDLTRISRGKLDLRLGAVSGRTLLENAMDICSDEIDAKNVRVSMNVAPGEHWLMADPARLQQVLWNVLKNAIKFSEPKGAINVRCFDAPDGQVVIEVHDEGVGIDSELLPRIFDAFKQGENANSRYFGGLGLGLAISQALVHLHGGSISAESAGKGRGALFRIVLPGAEPPETLPKRVDTPPEDLARVLRILLVEDHEDTAAMMNELLIMHGHVVAIARTVRAAIECAKAEEFDLIVSDLGLPDGSGVDVMSALRAEGRSIKGIALSGYGMESDRQKTAAAGFAEHLVKPVSFRDLQAAITRVTSFV